jgi:hypothetical protein
MQAADFYECALREFTRPELDKSWAAILAQKKVSLSQIRLVDE